MSISIGQPASPLLFSDGDLSTYLRKQRDLLRAEISNCGPDYLLQISEVDYHQYLVGTYSFDLLQLQLENIYQHAPQDIQIDVSNDPRRNIPNRNRLVYVQGTLIKICVPFTGNAVLFRYAPSTSTYSPPRAEVTAVELILSFGLIETDSESLAREYQEQLEDIKRHVEWVNNDLKNFNSSISTEINRLIQQRKQKLLADRKLSSSLGIPLRRRDDAPKTYAEPSIRRKLVTQPPTVSTRASFQPEPILSDSEYENILRIIQSMTNVMELSPQAFVQMGEEDLRTHFLVQLNGQYEGQATGETFNFSGKTDILIRVEGKNIFIAECKFWTGPKGLTETLDQLLSYTSWRDTKTAVLLFNRKKDFSSVVAKIPEIVEAHPNFKQSLGTQNETVFKYRFHQPSDTNREIVLTIMAFDIPQSK